MSCILAITANDKVYMASDSITVNDCRQIVGEPKIWQHNGILFGVTGEHAVLQVLKYKLPDIPNIRKEPAVQFLVTTIAPVMKEKLEEHGLLGEKSNFSIVTALDGKVFDIDGNFAVVEQPEVYATGMYHGFAAGYMTALMEFQVEPLKILEMTMEQMFDKSTGVKRPAVYEVL